MKIHYSRGAVEDGRYMFHFLTLPERLPDLAKRLGYREGVLETLPHTNDHGRTETKFYGYGPGRGVSRIDKYETGEVWMTAIDSEGHLWGCDNFIGIPQVYQLRSLATEGGWALPIRRIDQYLEAMSEELARVRKGGKLQRDLFIDRDELVRRLRAHLIGFGYAAIENDYIETASQAFEIAGVPKRE